MVVLFLLVEFIASSLLRALCVAMFYLIILYSIYNLMSQNSLQKVYKSIFHVKICRKSGFYPSLKVVFIQVICNELAIQVICNELAIKVRLYNERRGASCRCAAARSLLPKKAETLLPKKAEISANNRLTKCKQITNLRDPDRKVLGFIFVIQ